MLMFLAPKKDTPQKGSKNKGRKGKSNQEPNAQ